MPFDMLAHEVIGLGRYNSKRGSKYRLYEKDIDGFVARTERSSIRRQKLYRDDAIDN